LLENDLTSWIRRCAALVGAATLLLAVAAPAAAQKVRIATSAGDIVVMLDHDKAPKTVDNFLAYVKAGHYNGTIFHRVIPNFMIQGGGMTADMKEKPTRAPVALEARNGLVNARGTIAMARTSAPDSATAQFFLNVKDNAFLDAANSPDGNGYAVFGRIADDESLAVIDRIRQVPTANAGPYQNVPVKPVTINKVSLEN
jgi:peptidyl-prolyl cis-trans isomerase A (cyclophilin A)